MIFDTTDTKPIDARITAVGSIPDGLGPSARAFFNQITIHETDVDYQNQQCAGLSVDHIVKGSKTNGSRIATIHKMRVQADSKCGTVNDGMYVGHAAQAFGEVPVTHDQSLYGANYYGIVNVGCTGYFNVTGCEFNTMCAEEVVHKTGIQVASQVGDVKHGRVTDAGISVGSALGACGYRDGLIFSDFHGGRPITPDGTLIRTVGKYEVLNGIDLTSYTFTGNVFASKGFTLAGDGSFSARGKRHALASTEAIAITSPLIVLGGNVYVSFEASYRQVLIGPPDSDGPGYRSLRVAN